MRCSPTSSLQITKAADIELVGRPRRMRMHPVAGTASSESADVSQSSSPVQVVNENEERRSQSRGQRFRICGHQAEGQGGTTAFPSAVLRTERPASNSARVENSGGDEASGCSFHGSGENVKPNECYPASRLTSTCLRGIPYRPLV